MALCEQAQPEILRDIGILIFVDEHIFEALLIGGQDVGILAEQAQIFEEKIAEIGGIQLFQAFLIEFVQLAAAAIGESTCFTHGDFVGGQAPIFPAIDEGGEGAGGPALFVNVLGLDHLLHQADLVVRIEDCEIGTQADQFGVAAENFGADGVKGAKPRHAFGNGAEQMPDPLFHLACRLVGEGDGENLGGERFASRNHVGDTGGENAGFACSGTCKNKNRAVNCFDRTALLGVQSVKIGCIAMGDILGTRRQPAGTRGVGEVIIVNVETSGH